MVLPTGDELTKLSKAQLRELKTKIDFQLSRGRDPLSRDEAAVFEALRKNSLSPVTEAKLFDAVGRSGFSGVVEFVNNFIDRSCGVELHYDQRHALTIKLFGLLRQYLDSRDEPSTAVQMCKLIDYLPYAVDREAPGAARGKMLHLFVRTSDRLAA